jgi:hypothetical protein
MMSRSTEKLLSFLAIKRFQRLQLDEPHHLAIGDPSKFCGNVFSPCVVSYSGKRSHKTKEGEVSNVVSLYGYSATIPT